MRLELNMLGNLFNVKSQDMGRRGQGAWRHLSWFDSFLGWKGISHRLIENLNHILRCKTPRVASGKKGTTTGRARGIGHCVRAQGHWNEDRVATQSTVSSIKNWNWHGCIDDVCSISFTADSFMVILHLFRSLLIHVGSFTVVMWVEHQEAHLRSFEVSPSPRYLFLWI